MTSLRPHSNVKIIYLRSHNKENGELSWNLLSEVRLQYFVGCEKMTYIPYQPPGFLDECELLDKRIDGKKTWRSQDGKRLYQWDSQHGDIEVYDKRGYHLGCLDKITGRGTKKPVFGRRLHDV